MKVRRGFHRISPSGFTLLEIMISIGILGVVIVIVYGVFARTLTAKEYTEARAAEAATARAILNRLVRDLQMATTRSTSTRPQPTPSPDRGGTLPQATQQILFLSKNHVETGVPFDDLAFSAMLRRPSTSPISAADLAVVRYFAQADPANPSRHVLFRETVFSLSGGVFDPEKPDPASTVRLLDGIAGLEFRFFDGREWVQEWDSGDGRSYGPMPQAVDIALALWNTEGEAEVYHTALDLPLAKLVPGPRPPGESPTPGPTPSEDDDDES